MRDVSPGQWIEATLRDFNRDAVRVSSVVPEGFESYIRILHPAQRRVDHGSEPVRWSTVASWTGRVVHPQMQFDRIANLRGPNDYPSWGFRPQEGVLSLEHSRHLASLLRPFTSSPNQCWFCVWEGYGFLDQADYRTAPRVKTFARNYLLYGGPLDAVTSFGWDSQWQSPNLWWPDDRSWCVGTDIDLPETYVGGSRGAIDRILHDDQFEAMVTSADARVDIGADSLNPPVD